MTSSSGHGDRIELAPGISVRAADVQLSAVRASGPGGQNVNKVSTKIELRVALASIPLPAAAMQRLRALAGRRINDADELVIAASSTRSQADNRAEAIERLRDLVERSLRAPRPRIATKPTRGSERRRQESKENRSKTKQNRQSKRLRDHGE